jgi:hypothetical protein
MEQRRNQYAIFVELSQGSRPVGRSGSRSKDNIINSLDEVGKEYVNWNQQTEGKVTWEGIVNVEM